MKQFLKYFLAALLALFVGGAVLMIVFFSILGAFTKTFTQGLSAGDKPAVTVTAGAREILFLDLTKSYNELANVDYLGLLLNKGSMNSVGLVDVLHAISEAKTDDKIKGLYIKSGSGANGLASLEQIRDAIKDFKTSGKFVVTYAESYSQTDYYTASVADSIYVHPMGGVEIKGLASTIMFFKGALDKLEVKPEIFYCGQFKSATEPFRLDRMSEPNRKQLAAMQADVWQEFVKAFSEKTGKTEEEINQIARTYALRTPEDAVNYKFVNGIKYKDEVENVLKQLTGKEDKDEVPFIALGEYVAGIKRSVNKDEIAVLVAEGNIIDGKSSSSAPVIASEDIIEEIRKIRDNDNIKGVVIRVNSGGGSALASENIHRELLLLRAKKPYVVSMGDYAASGGYYIAAHADSIYAMPTTITGSIGVFGMMFSTRDLMKNKLGLTTDTEKNAPYADFPTLARDFTAEERVIIQSSVDSTYARFKQRVADGRKMSVARVDSIGQGRIWTGTEAVKNGLVDALGGLERAVSGVAGIANVNNYKIVTYPKADNNLSSLLRIMNATSISEAVLKDLNIQKEWGNAYQFYSMLLQSHTQQNGLQQYMYLPFQVNFR
ncbi:MAG: signal peptide peptidase SppA [Bacteroidetes bacterium 47-18]|nr:MAG: signal peptide peptidase SppA [Bacteroidetes bacterium 47-18]